METNLGWRPLTKFLRKVARALKVGANLRYNIKTKKRVSQDPLIQKRKKARERERARNNSRKEKRKQNANYKVIL